MEEKINEDVEEFEGIKDLNDIEEVQEVPIGNVNTMSNIEEEIKEKLISSNQKVNNQNDESDIYIRLASENEIELEEKENLITVFDNLKNVLNKKENKPKSIDQVYEMYLENEVITKSHIREQINELFLKFMFFFEGPLYGIVFLIGIFQMKSLESALSDLIKNSVFDYYHCNFKSNCNITIVDVDTNTYDFYNYYYESSMNETIDFNLIMITGFLGNIILKWKGVKISSFLLSLFNFGSIIWLLNFDFYVGAEFDYDWIKILNLCFIYFLLLCGIGGSALLSHQILVESHLKYKHYLINKLRNELEPIKIEKDEIQELDLQKTQIKQSANFSLKKQKSDNKVKSKLNMTKTFIGNSNAKDILIKNREKQKREKLEDKIKKKEKNKFDFFFMICLTTIIGYLGKYSMNILLDLFLKKIYGNSYNKRYFLIYIMILYGFSIAFSILLYQLFKVSIFEYDKKEEEKNKIIKISKICGYIIYSEKVKPIIEPKRNCCTLFCESIQNCCNETFCYLINALDIGTCDAQCTCSNCIYDPNDYNKDQEVFRYCYKTQRKSFWCNKFITNKSQKKIFPYMLEYFILQLTTIGFEKQYEQYKLFQEHRKTYITVFISTFILFFYFTLSFCRFFRSEKEIIENENEEDKEKDNVIKKAKTKETITKLSNEILNGTHGILLFNGVFSLIFSSFYLSYISVKSFFFRDNINIIFMPILMNKFYYFTLNYYCIYTAEKDKKFEIISNSSLISIYIGIWNIIITLIKWSIPNENSTEDYNYFNILYIIQIIFSSLPSLGVVIFILVGFFISSGLKDFFDWDCSCEECANNFNLHKFCFCLFSFLFCFGGLWTKCTDFETYEYECCNAGECCDIGDNCCNVYCLDNIIYCDCCCCNKKSKRCYSDFCYTRCDTCKICGCCGNKN